MDEADQGVRVVELVIKGLINNSDPLIQPAMTGISFSRQSGTK